MMLKLPNEFVVATSFRLPGLGLLVLPESPAPTWLAAYALHTALAITLLSETEQPIPLTGTIEELTRDGQLPQRAILLDFAPDGTLPIGTRLQVSEAQPLF